MKKPKWFDVKKNKKSLREISDEVDQISFFLLIVEIIGEAKSSILRTCSSITQMKSFFSKARSRLRRRVRCRKGREDCTEKDQDYLRGVLLLLLKINDQWRRQGRLRTCDCRKLNKEVEEMELKEGKDGEDSDALLEDLLNVRELYFE